MIYGLEVENQLDIMEGKSEKETNDKMLKHINYFIGNLKKTNGD